MRQTGASVKLGDAISTDDFSLDPAEVERLLTPRTKAIVVMHYGGYPSQMQEIMSLASEHDLFVIEDAAHAPGARVDGASLGTIGHAGCFSFFPNKNMTTGEGGAVVFRDEGPAARARLLRSHAMTTLTWDRHRGHATSYDVLDVGFNYRIDELRAALGVSQLARVASFNAARATLADRYRQRLGTHRGLDLPYAVVRGEPSYHLAPVLARSLASRDGLREALRVGADPDERALPPDPSVHELCGRGIAAGDRRDRRPRADAPSASLADVEQVDEVCDLLFQLVDGDGDVG